MTGYVVDNATPDEVAAYSPVVDAVRALIPTAIRTAVPAEAAARAAALLREANDILSADLGDASYGTKFGADGAVRNWGNTMEGLRNPIAPPILVEHSAELTWAEFTLDAQFEGPPALVHGGVSAMILDQVLGACAAHFGRPGLTAYLNVTYRRPTPLHQPLRCEAQVDRVEGHKTFVVGRVIGPDGQPTAEAEALFVLPRALRDKIDADGNPLVTSASH